MYYIIESEGLVDRWMFRLYQNACMAALELAQRTPHEVQVIVVSGSSGFGNPVLYVFNRRQSGLE